MQSSKKRQRKKKSLQRYRALSDNCMENKVFVSKNDRSKWPARPEFDRSSLRSGRTLSVDRPLFAALDSFFVVDQDTAQYSICSALEKCVSLAYYLIQQTVNSVHKYSCWICCPFYKISKLRESNNYILHTCLVSAFNISVQSQSTMFRAVQSMHFITVSLG